MANVLLLRAPVADGPDKYEDAFRPLGYHPVSVPVLETVLVNLGELGEVVKNGPVSDGLGGVIVTSARACEAWRAAVVELVKTGVAAAGADWTHTPFYVVGEATATALADIRTVAGSGTLAPRDIRGAAASGTAEKLAHFILQDLPPTSPRTLLYLTGDKNRDTLPTILQNGGIQLRALQVYATQGSSTFGADLQRAIAASKTGSDSWWIVYFAPSAADFVTPVLREHFTLPTEDTSEATTRIAAIGPTTSTFLRETLHLRVDVVPPKPLPDALAKAIRAFDAPES